MVGGEGLCLAVILMRAADWYWFPENNIALRSWSSWFDPTVAKELARQFREAKQPRSSGRSGRQGGVASNKPSRSVQKKFATNSHYSSLLLNGV